MTLTQMVIVLWEWPGGARHGTALRSGEDTSDRGHVAGIVPRYEGIPSYLACRGPVSHTNVYTKRGM